MEVTIRNNQRLIRISRRRIERLARKALSCLIRKESCKRPGRKRAGVFSPSSLPDPASVELSILFVSDGRMRRLNRAYRGIDRTTDVLSFPQVETAGKQPEPSDPQAWGGNLYREEAGGTVTVPLGDIVISLPQALKQAEEYGVPLYDEIARLLIHGLLHLFGYDHERGGHEAVRMRKREAELAEALCR